ncbi:MAG TPA: hypothetical protein VEH84_01365 [Alphaproteobacteria bacterium]|nr:hypothetical protein [Alphaproteobacteria bacterium]
MSTVLSALALLAASLALLGAAAALDRRAGRPSCQASAIGG